MQIIFDLGVIFALITLVILNSKLSEQLTSFKRTLTYWDEKSAAFIIDMGNTISDVKTHADELDELRSMIADSDRGIQSANVTLHSRCTILSERHEQMNRRLDNHFTMLAGHKDEIRFLYEMESRIHGLEYVWNQWLRNVNHDLSLGEFVEGVTNLYGRINGIHEEQSPGVASDLECTGVDVSASSGDLSEGTTKAYSRIGD